MLFSDEVVPVADLEGVPEPAGEAGLADKEIALAEQLVASLSAPFEPEKYSDTYREQVLALIEAKAGGETIEALPTTPAKAPVIDLMAALEASLNEAKAAKKTA
jgi:DNA end-binding protein Ku